MKETRRRTQERGLTEWIALIALMQGWGLTFPSANGFNFCVKEYKHLIQKDVKNKN
jgi:hypothetical protein